MARSRTVGWQLAVLVLGACGGRSDPSPPAFLDHTAITDFYRRLGRGIELVMADSMRQGLAELRRAHQINPGSDEVSYLIAAFHAMKADTMGTARAIDSLTAVGSCLLPDSNTFRPVANAEPVRRAIDSLRARAPAGHASEIAFTVPIKDLFPEGIAYDSVSRAFFLSSLRHHNLLRAVVDQKGAPNVSVYSSADDSLYSVLGMKVDPIRRRLWVNSSAEGFAEDEPASDNGLAAVVAYDLTSGKREKRWSVSRPPGRLVNDLVLGPEGEAYVTDTQAGTVYRIRFDADVAEELFPPKTLFAPNGIEITPDGKALLIADNRNGLVRMDLASKTLRPVPQPSGLMPLFIDGLAFHGNTLTAVIHALSGGRIVAFDMNSSFDRIESARVLDCNNPLFGKPTTSVVVGDTLFFIGNSQFDRIGTDGKPTDPAQLRDIVILKLSLR